MTAGKYLKYFNVLSFFDTKRTRDIFNVNPTIEAVREDAIKALITVCDYNSTTLT